MIRPLLALALAFLLSGCGGSSSPSQPVPPIPAPAEPPIVAWILDRKHFGYFYDDDGQIAETADHVTYLFEVGNGGDQAAAARMIRANIPCILVVQDCLFTLDNPKSYLGDAEATARLTARFDAHVAAGTLGYVVGLCIGDELERDANVPEIQIQQACAILRTVCLGYPALADVFFSHNYGNVRDFRALTAIRGPSGKGVIGLDDYDAGSDVLAGGIADLQARVVPGQLVALLPGAASPWNADPAPFVAYVLATPQCWGTMAFLWVGPQGLRNNPSLQPAYRAAGMLFKQFNLQAAV